MQDIQCILHACLLQNELSRLNALLESAGEGRMLSYVIG